MREKNNEWTFSNKKSKFSLEELSKILKEIEVLKARENTLMGIVVTNKFPSGKVLQVNGFYFFITSETFEKLKSIAVITEHSTLSLFGVPVIQSDETAFKIMFEGEFRSLNDYEEILKRYSIPPSITGDF